MGRGSNLGFFSIIFTCSQSTCNLKMMREKVCVWQSSPSPFLDAALLITDKWTQYRFPFIYFFFFRKLNLTPIIVNKYDVSTDNSSKKGKVTWHEITKSFLSNHELSLWMILIEISLESLWWLFVLTTGIYINMFCEVPNEIYALNISKCSLNSRNPD